MWYIHITYFNLAFFNPCEFLVLSRKNHDFWLSQELIHYRINCMCFFVVGDNVPCLKHFDWCIGNLISWGGKALHCVLCLTYGYATLCLATAA